jgi:hypothetical protein
MSADSGRKGGEPDFIRGKSNSEMIEALRASLKNDFKVYKDEIAEDGSIRKTADQIKREVHQQAVHLLLEGDVINGIK